MKKILVTGAGSYIGTSFCTYMKPFGDAYRVDTLDMLGDAWKQADFHGYDVVFHVAGIAHRKETQENAPLYFKVNRDLAVETAKKAREAGVGLFVFLSSMSVYGMDSGVITSQTLPNPVTNYGRSKLQAEAALNELASEHFRVAILRPPMVYGKGCRGNFQTVIKLLQKSPVFPKIDNRRSLLYIDHLCAFVKLLVDQNRGGLFFPKNREDMRTDHMAQVLAAQMGRKVFFSRLAGVGVGALRPFVRTAQKAFGSLIYEGTEEFDYCYCTVDNDESVRRSL